jgi:hypothetical protein
MKITLCGSIAFYDEMLAARQKLEQAGHQVKLPPVEVKDEKGRPIPVKKYYEKRKAETNETSWIWERKNEAMKTHFAKIAWSDAILVINHDKNGIQGYIGANTLMEMGMALHLDKKIFLLKNIPEISYKEEILGTKPILLNEDLSKIK